MIVTEREARDEVGLRAELPAVVRMVLDGVPWITSGGGSGQEGWYFRVSDQITRWDGVESREDLIGSLEAIAQQQRQEYAAMSSAKADMVRGTQPVQAVVVEQPLASPHWYEHAHPPEEPTPTAPTLISNKTDDAETNHRHKQRCRARATGGHHFGELEAGS